MHNLFRVLASLPYSLYFNLRYLPLGQALRIPILLAPNVRVREMKGKIQLTGPIKPGITHIGFHRVHVLDEHSEHTILSISEGATLHLHSTAKIGQGTKLIVRPGAELTLREGFSTSGNAQIACYKNISIGSGVISWDTLITDSDSHAIFNDQGVRINEDKPVYIADKVWIGCRCTILKGTIIPENTVVGANSLLSGTYTTPNTILAGNPAKPVKTIDHFEL